MKPLTSSITSKKILQSRNRSINCCVSYKLIPTPPFERELKKLAKKYVSIKSDISALADELLINPRLGTPLGKDCYKIRMAISSKGKGKSGGARVITYVQIVQETIFLIAVYDKAEISTLSDLEIQDRLQRLQ